MVVLSGYFGEKNLGDEVMLENVLNRWCNSVPITVLVNNRIVRLESSFPNVQQIVVSKSNLLGIIKVLVCSKAVIWIGGTCLYDKQNIEGLKELFALVLFNSVFVRKFHFLNVGVGAITTRRGYLLIKLILSLSKTITFRDSQSASIAMKIKNRHYSLGGDLFLLSKIDKVEKTSVNATSLAVFGVYNLTESVVKALSSKINLLYENGIIDRVLFIPFHKGRKNDDIFHQKVGNSLSHCITKEFVKYDSLHDLSNILEGVTCAFAFRLHSVVLCDLLDIKSLPVEYSPKVKFYSKSVGKRSVGLDFFDDLDITEGTFELASNSMLIQQITKVEESLVNMERNVL